MFRSVVVFQRGSFSSHSGATFYVRVVGGCVVSFFEFGRSLMCFDVRC